MADMRSSVSQAQSATDSTEGTLRAELLGRLLGAQAELEASIKALRDELKGSATALDGCESQLASLQQLQLSVSSASPATLAGLKAQVMASIAASHIATQEARTAVEKARAEESANLAAASAAATRSEVQSLRGDLFDKHIFDAYLHFESPEDEAAYRQREVEARRYIDKQLARNTHEGDLNASGGAAGQMLDAAAHGADKSPEFLARWDRLVDSIRRQHEAMHVEGKSTEEFDRNLQAAVRRFLKSKGLSDSEIEAKLAGNSDPLAVVQPYLRSEADAKALDESVSRANSAPVMGPANSTTMAVPVAAAQVVSPVGLDDVMAKLQSSGIVLADQAAGNDPAHGVTAAKPAPAAQVRS